MLREGEQGAIRYNPIKMGGGYKLHCEGPEKIISSLVQYQALTVSVNVSFPWQRATITLLIRNSMWAIQNYF